MKCAQNEGKFKQIFHENSIYGFYLSSKRPQFNVLTCKFHLHLMQKGLQFAQKKELPSKMISSPFYEQKMRLSSFLAHKIIWRVKFFMQIWFLGTKSWYFTRFRSHFVQIEAIMRIISKKCPSGVSIGWHFYPQYKHNFEFQAQTTICICGDGVQGI